ncbi:hypothetical protein N9805_04555 [Paracoccaceae bacterium]|nr:hypothetical protein [Paracoccaceae bacterium]
MIIVNRFIKQILYVSALLSLFTNPISAQNYLEEEEIDDVWTVGVEQYGEAVSDWVVVASVNGKVTHGDRLRIRIPVRDLEKCSIGNTLTTFYTTNIDTEDKKAFIKNKMIPAELNGNNIYVEILFAIPFLSVHLAYIDMSWNKLENIKEYFHGSDEISLLLKDRNNHEGITIINSDYFDVSFNNYSTKGLNSALDRARAECERLVNNF